MPFLNSVNSSNSISNGLQENEALVQGTNTHFGTYAVEASRMITFYIAHAFFANWEGTEQKRSFTLVGDTLTYVVPVTTNGTSAIGVVVWKRFR
jgi:hypothetical protein